MSRRRSRFSEFDPFDGDATRDPEDDDEAIESEGDICDRCELPRGEHREDGRARTCPGFKEP